MSVNGRPFRPDPTSYLMTGIPCGNPQRYKSRAVIRTTRSSVPFENQQVGIPGRGTVSQAELELKKLLQKQLETNLESNDVQRRMDFTTATKIDAFGKATAGIRTLEEFRVIENLEKRCQELQDNGLREPQISLQLEQDGYFARIQNLTHKKRKMVHPDHVKMELSDIQTELFEKQQRRKTSETQEEQVSSTVEIGRHAREVEASILQGKKHLPLAHLFLNKEKSPNLDGNQAKTTSEDDQLDTETIKQKEPVLSTDIQPILQETIDKTRWNKEEILARFPNYNPGTSGNILYITNLAKSVTETDLVSLFIRFQVPDKKKIVFKLMKGRMKGQAFVTFDSPETARQALESVHGFVFKGKPILIQYGRASA